MGVAAPTGRLAKGLWIAGGCLAVGVGAVGIVLPVLPTTVFFIIAAWCFSKSSPRLEAWVLDLPGVGPMVQDYRDGFGMARRVKITATTMMSLVLLAGVVFVIEGAPLRVLTVALGLVGASYIWFVVPTRERVERERLSLDGNVGDR